MSCNETYISSKLSLFDRLIYCVASAGSFDAITWPESKSLVPNTL